MKVGITGHQRLENPPAWSWVEEKMIEELSHITPPLIGISSLAIGADQLFAKIVLKHKGKLHIIIPFEDYERTFDEDDKRWEYKNLLEKSSKIKVLPVLDSDEESYFAAGKRIVELSDLMLAVWNGKKAAGLGGTGDVVKYARDIGRKVIHINTLKYEVETILPL